MKLDYKKAFLIGFGLFSAQLMWVIYNTYMPIFLQAGSPTFDAKLAVQTRGFGLSATLTGIIMTLDNIAAFFIQPLMGPVSDRTRTRLGRRMPYIVACAPVAVIAFALIPLAPQMIPAELNGQLSQLGGWFALFLAAAVVMLVAMALWRTPLFALLPDLIPSPLRSQANGVINVMGGLGGILAFVLGGLLYNVYRPLPFWFGGALTLIAVGILFWKVKEPRELAQAAESGEGLQVLHYLPGAEYKPHHDYFDPAKAGTPSIVARGGQRVGTLVMYLNAPDKGGGTTFPDVALAVAPIKGNAVFFSYDRPHPITRTLHGGAPVIAGEKWVATKWLREGRFT